MNNDIILTEFARVINSDRYQYTESDIFLMENMQNKIAVFDMFFRKTEDGGFAVVSGIQEVIHLIEVLNTTSEEEKRKYFSKILEEEHLINFLSKMKFTGDLYAIQDGEIVYPNEPVITFGSRRAHGFDSAVEGNKAAIIGGCYGHSNLVTEYKYGIPSNGTMSHSYIQSFGVGAEAEKEAFVTFIKHRRQRKNNSLILLVDTYDTINIGIENAIKSFKECGIDDSYEGVYGVRLDSGDLAYQSKKCRKRFDEEGFTKAKITLTNSLDEQLIRSLREQGACVDMYGVGDAIAVSKSYPCFGGVYKIVELDEEPLIKISGDVIKISNPGFKEVYRIFDKEGFAYADLISLVKDDNDKEKLLNNEELMIRDEKYEFKNSILKKDEYTYKKLTKLYIKDGVIDKELHDELFDIMKSQKHYFDSLAKVSPERKRLENPHSYKVDLSSDLINLKYGLINKIKNV